jgi:diadenosine tetraphosphatase ApaH/serine/threonine PP2A family protein phosphatase
LRIGVFSDIHANWQALDAVLGDCSDVDDIICLGDIVGYGGDPKRCLDFVRRQGWLTLVGNHDRACTDPEILQWFNEEAAIAIRWTVSVLEAEDLGWLKALPETHVKEDVLLVHASPREPIYEYVLDAATAEANLLLLQDRVCFHGHTHVPGIFFFNEGSVAHDYRLGIAGFQGPMLINPGSIGQPRDAVPDASYGVWDTDTQSFEFRRVGYDRDAAKRAIIEAGLPERFAFRLDYGR